MMVFFIHKYTAKYSLCNIDYVSTTVFPLPFFPLPLFISTATFTAWQWTSKLYPLPLAVGGKIVSTATGSGQEKPFYCHSKKWQWARKSVPLPVAVEKMGIS